MLGSLKFVKTLKKNQAFNSYSKPSNKPQKFQKPKCWKLSYSGSDKKIFAKPEFKKKIVDQACFRVLEK
jgi:hypothetical protein